jgi:xanthine/uracil/vitamin C permease (AzgA family)
LLFFCYASRKQRTLQRKKQPNHTVLSVASRTRQLSCALRFATIRVLPTGAGNIPRANLAFIADAIASMMGGLLGSSAIVCYVESSAGMREGGRTGFAALVCGILFFLASFLSPLFGQIPAVRICGCAHVCACLPAAVHAAMRQEGHAALQGCKC